jgi:hypothetical protein
MGFSDVSVEGSDLAADLALEVGKSITKVLLCGLKERGNSYNTSGAINVALILDELMGPHWLSYVPENFEGLLEEVLTGLEDELKDKELSSDYRRAIKTLKNRINRLYVVGPKVP